MLPPHVCADRCCNSAWLMDFWTRPPFCQTSNAPAPDAAQIAMLFAAAASQMHSPLNLFGSVRSSGKVSPDDVLRNATMPPVAMAMGFPCVDISIAGNRQGFEASHSSLWRHAWALAMGLKLQYILFENVANIATKSMQKVFREAQQAAVVRVQV